ncbi:MAG: sulfite exporter TauE/SafE family protein [Alphaproteobacteria bacterium]|nr:sulfite exporter TauE/SafE family protein [Alphaproteobacteria bacterium]
MNSLLLQVILGACVAGFVQGLSGFAFGLVAMTFWAWSISPHLAGPLVVFGSLVGQLLSAGTIRRGFDWRRTQPFLVGGLLGVPLGAALLPHMNQIVFKLIIGALLTVWCPTMLLIRELPRVTKGGRLADGGVGLIGGVMGGLGGLSGPAPTLWCTLRGWDKDAQRSVFQSFNLAMQAVTLVVYAMGGLITREAIGYFAVVAPAILIPSILGTRLYARFSATAFRRLVLILLLISGMVLLASSVPDLLSPA